MDSNGNGVKEDELGAMGNGCGDSDVALQVSAKVEISLDGASITGKEAENEEVSTTTPAATSINDLDFDLPDGIRNLNLRETQTAIENDMISTLIADRMSKAEASRRAKKLALKERNRKEVEMRKKFQKVDLSSLLPKAGWIEILKNLDDEDKEKLMALSLFWRELMKAERVEILFQSVFPILHQWPILKANDMLNCRLLSTKCKGFIDNYLQNFCEYVKVRKAEDPPLPLLDVIVVDDMIKLATFTMWSEIHLSETNPFISRKLTVGLTGNVQQVRHDRGAIFNFNSLYWVALKDLLHRSGHELRGLVIFFPETKLDVFYNELCYYLHLVPNVNNVAISLSILDPYRQYPALEMRKLIKCIRSTPLPELPNLKELRTTYLPFPIVQALITKYGPNLKAVEDRSYFEKPLHAINGSHLANLKEFVGCYSKAEIGGNVSFQHMNWPKLEVLKLQFNNVNLAGVPVVFGNINTLGNHLKTLWLTIQRDESKPVLELSDIVLKRLSLDLPHLEHLVFTVGRINLKTIDFLLPASKLKLLKVFYLNYTDLAAKKRVEAKIGSCDLKTLSSLSDVATSSKPCSTQSAELIQFSDYVDRLYESNIWKIFPELQYVFIWVITRLNQESAGTLNPFCDLCCENVTDTCGWKFYSREEYNKLQKNCSN